MLPRVRTAPRRPDPEILISGDVDTVGGFDPGPCGIEDALARITATTLVLGIDTDRLFPVDGQHRIARSIPNTLDGNEAVVLTSDFGHDGFLIEADQIASLVHELVQRPLRVTPRLVRGVA